MNIAPRFDNFKPLPNVILTEAQDSQLIANGYEPVPVSGKAVNIHGWTNAEITPERLAAWRGEYPDGNTGLRTDILAAIDIDVVNEGHSAKLAELAEQVLGVTPLHRRGSKGVLLVYRRDEALRKITIKPDDKAQAKLAKVELLGSGQQFVAFGIHPDTDKPYEWLTHDPDFGDTFDPLSVPRDRLPVVTPAQLRRFAGKAASLLAELGYGPATVSGDTGEQRAEPSAHSGEPVAEKVLREVLSFLDPFGDREDWRNSVAAIRAANIIGDDDEHTKGRTIALEWSRGELGSFTDDSDPPKYTGDEAVNLVFDTMPPKAGGITVATLFKRGQAEGWQGNPFDSGRSIKEVFQKHVLNLPTNDNDGGQWPEPFDIFADRDYVRDAKLTRDMLPDAIADFAFDQADLMSVDPAMIAMPALAVAASVFHDAYQLQPKSLNTEWRESPRLWLLLVADSGSRKSPAMRAAMAPLRDLNKEFQRDFAREMAQYEKATEQLKSDQQRRRREPVDAADLLSDVKPEKPRRKDTYIDDVTLESLPPILEANTGGPLAFKDELSGFIGSLDAYRNREGKDRPAWLELYNGDEKLWRRSDSSKCYNIPNWSVSFLGGIQPDHLQRLMARNSLESDGLLQRFLPFFGKRFGIAKNRPPDAIAKNQYHRVIRGLSKLPTPVPFGLVRLSPEGQEVFDKFERHSAMIAMDASHHSAFREHADKWPGMFARLILVFHGIECIAATDHIERTVSLATVERAYHLMTGFLCQQSAQFYERFFRATSKEESQARWVAGHILAHGMETVTKRDLQRAYAVVSEDDAVLECIMTDLQKIGWIGEAKDSRRGGGDGSRSWPVNPKVGDGRFAKQRAIEQTARKGHRKGSGTKVADWMKRSRTS